MGPCRLVGDSTGKLAYDLSSEGPAECPRLSLRIYHLFGIAMVCWPPLFSFYKDPGIPFARRHGIRHVQATTSWGE
jgi:hypothetical protein